MHKTPDAAGLEPILALSDALTMAFMDFVQQRKPIPREIIFRVLIGLTASEAVVRNLPLASLLERVREAYYEHAVLQGKQQP